MQAGHQSINQKVTKSNLVHFGLKIWHLVATILVIFHAHLHVIFHRMVIKMCLGLQMLYVIRNERSVLIMEFAGVRQSITNCISKSIQCEDWMLTGPTSKRVPFNMPRSTNETSRWFDFPNSSITASVSSVMTEIGKKFGGGQELQRRGEGSGHGYFPPQWG